MTSLMTVRSPTHCEPRAELPQCEIALTDASVAKGIDQGEHFVDGAVSTSGFWRCSVQRLEREAAGTSL